MLEKTSGFAKIYVAPGYTDLRAGIETLAAKVRSEFRLDPYEKNVLFLFCGRRTDRIKGLLWEGNGFLLLYKRFESGSLQWPRTSGEAMKITPDQYHLLLRGFRIVAAHPVQDIRPTGLI